jgi:trehalose 6-phosphate synthase/phosphatase
VVEVKSANINKGKFVAKLLSEEEFDFVLAFGDDITDEDMFGVLKGKHHFTVKVGLGRTTAKYNVIGVNNVISFLEQLSQIRESIAGRA